MDDAIEGAMSEQLNRNEHPFNEAILSKSWPLTRIKNQTTGTENNAGADSFHLFLAIHVKNQMYTLMIQAKVKKTLINQNECMSN